jgi:hypothetical protein
MSPIEMFVQAQEQHNKNRCCILRKQREDAVDCCIDFYTDKCCQGLDLTRVVKEKSDPEDILEKVKNYILDVDLNIDFGDGGNEVEEGPIENGNGGEGLTQENIGNGAGYGEGITEEIRENEEETVSDGQQGVLEDDNVESGLEEEGQFGSNIVEQETFNTEMDFRNEEEDEEEQGESIEKDEVVESQNIGDDFDDEGIGHDMKNEIPNEMEDSQYFENDFNNEEINHDVDDISQNEQSNDRIENEDDLIDNVNFPKEDFSQEKEEIEDNNLIDQDESIGENKLDNLNFENEEFNEEEENPKKDDFDEFMDSKNEEILDSMDTEDKLDSSNSVSASTFHLRRRNKKLKHKNFKIEKTQNEDLGNEDMLNGRNENDKSNAKDGEKGEDGSSVINLENGNRRRREKRRVGESRDGTSIPKFRNTQVDLIGRSGRGGKGGKGGRVFGVDSVQNMFGKPNSIRPISGTMFHMNSFQNLLNDHMSISEKFKKRKIQGEKKGGNGSDGIEGEIRNRFMNSSDDFDVVIEDDSQTNKTITYNMTAVNRNNE